jgi:cell division protein FtsL
MAKSRKSPASILRFGPLMLAVGLCGLVAASAIGFVWHRNRNEQLVRDNALTRRRLEAQQKENQELEYRFLGLTRPEVLTERARVLGLDRPDPDQFIRVELAPMGSLATPVRTSVSLAVRSPQP